MTAAVGNTLLTFALVFLFLVWQSYSKYYPNDPQIQEWDDSFEKLWGFRVTLVADQWRKTQSEQRSQIGRAYPVDGVSQRETAPAFAVASSDSSPSSQHASVAAHSQSRSQSSSARSSPRDRHNVVLDPRLVSPGSVAHSGSPGRDQPQHQQQRLSPQHMHQAMGTGAAVHRSSVDLSGGGGPPSGRTLQPQQSLPSLKASGLLDSWKPPVEAFAQASISRGEERSVPAHHGHSQSLGRNVPQSMPIGYNWLAEGQ